MSGNASTTLAAYFDYRSPFAYLLSEVLPALADRQGVGVAWEPIDLLELSNFSGGLPYTEKKRAYVFVDAVRQARFHGVPIEVPEPFPVDSERALRLALALRDEPGFDALHQALFRAAWRERRDLTRDDVLSDCLRAAEFDVDAGLRAAADDATARGLAANTAAADDAGVFGVPTVVRNGELFWGLDALPILSWRLDGHD